MLGHENVDIQIIVIQLVNELFDEDAVIETTEETLESTLSLASAFTQEDLIPMLIQSLNTLKSLPEETQAIFNILSTTNCIILNIINLDIIDSLISIDPLNTNEILIHKTFLKYILDTLAQESFDSNQQYVSELLCVLLLNSKPNATLFLDAGGLDVVLTVLSKYIKSDPVELDEIEFMENLFGVMVTLVGLSNGKELFKESEGLELMIIMIK